MSPWFEGNIFDVTLVRGQHRDVVLTLQRLCIYNKGWRFQSWVLLITKIERINI